MKKKGFTLIELLAVIVILAILAFILIPVIQDLIANARYAAAADSVLNYVHAANTQATVDVGGFEEYKLNLSDTFELDSEIDAEELEKIKYRGKGPTYVYLLFSGEEKYVSEGHFCMWGYSLDYNFETGTSKSEIDYCGNGSQEPEGPQSCDVLRNNEYDTTTIFKIKNVEDLVCISEIAKTKSFLEKTIYLIKDIDFNNDASYENPNGTTYGDINGNGEVEGLKTELTTSAGFYPIGSSSSPFRGTFEGYAKSISNLIISRSQNNVGLFGYNKGLIQGFAISASVTGNSSVGSVVGYNDGGTIKEIIGDVTVKSYLTGYSSNFYIGGIVGNLASGDVKSILLKNVTVKTDAYGHFIGGLVGQVTKSDSNITGVIERGEVIVTDTTGYSGGWYIGRVTGNPAGTVDVYASNNVYGNASGNYGTWYALRDEILNAYDKVLDTYIGGDNNSSGYYFDYENEDSSNIIIKRTDKNPIKFTVKGKGTESEPYILDNVQHYKEASTLAGNGNSYKFKVTADIDFTGRHYYALGTNGNEFISDIDGDNHTLSNISFNCAENCGLISKNSHTIEALNLNNIKLVSNNGTVGGLVGYNSGTIKGINANDMNITGASSVGGIVGTNEGGTIKEVSANIYVKSTTTNYNSNFYIGGIVGNLASGDVQSILLKNVTVKTDAYGHFIGGLVGQVTKSDSNITGVIERGEVIVTDTTGYSGGWYIGRVTGNPAGTVNVYASNNVYGNASGDYGTWYALRDEILNAYDKTLDTYIGGDNDDSGYYFDYENDESSNIVLKRTKDYPITFTLQGNGSSNNPYIIDSYQHYKEASIVANGEYKFKITADIDFNGKHYYSLGTNGNILGSDIDGDMHTLSNITFNCAENCGLISQNSKTIEGLNLNNITITSNNGNVGGLVGYNTGTIKGINANDMNITGSSSVGGLIGVNEDGTIKEVAATVYVVSVLTDYNSTFRMGGLVGNLASGNVESVLLKDTTVWAKAYGHFIGGLVGQVTKSDSNITGVIEKGEIIVTDTTGYTGGWYIGRVTGNSAGTITVYASNNVYGNASGSYGTSYTFVPPTTVKYTVNSVSEEMDTLTYYDSKGLLDTVIGGDGDGSGYYLQYNGSGDSIIVVKAGNIPTPSPNPPEPGTGEPLEGGSVGDNPPTCVLEQVISRSEGIQPVLTCTDDEGAPTIRSQWNVNKNATTNQFSDIGIIKNGTVNGNSKTVRPYWSTSDPISVPTPNTCYYFRFGAQDASGNWSYYVTSKCYYGFGRSND